MSFIVPEKTARNTILLQLKKQSIVQHFVKALEMSKNTAQTIYLFICLFMYTARTSRDLGLSKT